jgi:hypothetical protein
MMSLIEVDDSPLHPIKGGPEELTIHIHLQQLQLQSRQPLLAQFDPRCLNNTSISCIHRAP